MRALSPALTLLSLLNISAGFNVVAPRTVLVNARANAPTMQFFNPKDVKTKQPKKRRGGMIYDDEVDTVSRGVWSPDTAENGEVDLANVGGVYYLAFIPFLLFFLAYSSGIFSFGYDKGNF